MKMKKTVIILFLIITSLNIASCQYPYKDVVEYVQNDMKFKEFCNLLNITTNDFEISKEYISYNCITVLEDYIRKEHIKDFSYFNLELLDKHKLLIEEVTDTLSGLSTKLNKNKCEINHMVPSMDDIKNVGVVIFLSKYCDNYIYLEVLGYDSQLFENKNYETVAFSQALTYLFKIENGKIKKVYTGEINHN